MKIIKDGDTKKIEQMQKQTKRFKCHVCDCVFEANKGEYEDAVQWEPLASAVCPCCSQTAYEIRMRGCAENGND